MFYIEVKVGEQGHVPTKGTKDSAAYDLYSSEDTVVYPRSYKRIHTDVSMAIPHLAGIISQRSGDNSKRGIQAYGLVDPDYRGEIMITLYNHNITEFRVKKGDRIAQMRFVELPITIMQVTEDLSTTERGEGGYGSTGR